MKGILFYHASIEEHQKGVSCNKIRAKSFQNWGPSTCKALPIQNQYNPQVILPSVVTETNKTLILNSHFVGCLLGNMNLNYMNKDYPLKCLGNKAKVLRYVRKWD